jgi:hypothetical protein
MERIKFKRFYVKNSKPAQKGFHWYVLSLNMLKMKKYVLHIRWTCILHINIHHSSCSSFESPLHIITRFILVFCYECTRNRSSANRRKFLSLENCYVWTHVTSVGMYLHCTAKKHWGIFFPLHINFLESFYNCLLTREQQLCQPKIVVSPCSWHLQCWSIRIEK